MAPSTRQNSPLTIAVVALTVLLCTATVVLAGCALGAERWLQAENAFIMPPTTSFVSLLQHCTYPSGPFNRSLVQCSTKNELCDLDPHSHLCALMQSGTTTRTLLICTAVGTAVACAAALAAVLVPQRRRARRVRVAALVVLVLAAAAASASLAQWGVFAQRYNQESTLFPWHHGAGFHLHIATTATVLVALVALVLVPRRRKTPRSSSSSTGYARVL